MATLLTWIGRIAGLLGVAISAAAMLARTGGVYYVGKFQIGTVLQVGMASMLVGCLAYLALMADAESRGPRK